MPDMYNVQYMYLHLKSTWAYAILHVHQCLPQGTCTLQCFSSGKKSHIISTFYLNRLIAFVCQQRLQESSEPRVSVPIPAKYFFQQMHVPVLLSVNLSVLGKTLRTCTYMCISISSQHKICFCLGTKSQDWACTCSFTYSEDCQKNKSINQQTCLLYNTHQTAVLKSQHFDGYYLQNCHAIMQAGES